VTLEPPPHGQRLSFQATTAVPDRDAARVHFDVLVDDLAAAADRVVAAGAVFVREHVSPGPGPQASQSPGASTWTRPATRSAW
jgi:hypothetical protein